MRIVQLALTIACTAASGAVPLDGSAPLTCTVQAGQDCPAGAGQCRPLEPRTNIAPVFKIDFGKRQVQSPYRTALLRVARLTHNAQSLVLQGSDLMFAWSALINASTGTLTVSIADRGGAYVAFGQCEVSR